MTDLHLVNTTRLLDSELMLTYPVIEIRIVGEVREVYVKTSDYELELLF